MLPESPADTAPSILVINVSRIGDTLLATPAIRAIAAAYPACRITCLGHPKRAEVFEHLPFVHRVGTITKQRARWMGRLSGRRYDLAFVYGHDRPLVEYALRVADKVVAFRQGDPSLEARLHRAVEVPAFQSRHSVHLQLLLPAALGIPPAGLRLSYRVAAAEDAWAKDTLRRELPGGCGPLIGLQVASFPTKAYRDWPIGHFIALCERILSGHPRAHFLIFGGKEEHARTEALHARFPHNSTLFAGRLSLRQTAALMGTLDLYIGVDTGPTHIMGTFDIPLVALYHCFSPSRLIGPLEHPLARAVDHPLADAGCTPDTTMDAITVDRVWHEVAAVLGAEVDAA